MMQQQTVEERPFPDVEGITRCLSDHFNTTLHQRPVIPEAGTLYDVRGSFKGFSEYWMEHLRFERFRDTSRILYRDQVTNTLFNRVRGNLNGGSGLGILLKGPHGIGKSHTLINLILKLLSTEGYLVTFMPDCEKWNSGELLMTMICSSFGATPEDVGFRRYKAGDKDLTTWDCLALMNAIDDVLLSMKKTVGFCF
jgi:hypothetical protein